MAYSAGSSSSSYSEMNVTPLIDVLLVLLIIFMVIVPVTPRGLESQVPQARRVTETQEQPVSVRVLAGASAGEVRFEVDGRAVGPAELEARLRQRLALQSRRRVWVSASPEMGYRVVAEVVSEAKSAGAETVGLGRL